VKKAALVLAIAATIGVWVADVLLLGVPAFRNGWATLPLFAAPLLLALLGKGGPGKLLATAWVVVLLGAGGWVAMRLFWGGIDGKPELQAGLRAPGFSLKDADGKLVSLADLTDDHRVLLVFFRGSG
jgi:hypothetical protein